LASINHELFLGIFSAFFVFSNFKFEFYLTGPERNRSGPVRPVTAVNRGLPSGFFNPGTGLMFMGRRVGACPTRSTQRKRVFSAKAKRKGLCVVHLII
jgi:hypothetical protein